MGKEHAAPNVTRVCNSVVLTAAREWRFEKIDNVTDLAYRSEKQPDVNKSEYKS